MFITDRLHMCGKPQYRTTCSSDLCIWTPAACANSSVTHKDDGRKCLHPYRCPKLVEQITWGLSRFLHTDWLWVYPGGVCDHLEMERDLRGSRDHARAKHVLLKGCRRVVSEDNGAGTDLQVTHKECGSFGFGHHGDLLEGQQVMDMDVVLCRS